MDNSYNPFSLEGKTILVTGASSGIGRAVAIECSKAGANLILSARDSDRLKETSSYLVGDAHKVIVADLSIEDEIKQLVRLLPPIDGVVFSAGKYKLRPLKLYSNKTISDVFSINTISSMLLVRYLLLEKRLLNNSSLVFISSVSSEAMPTKGNGIYSASKAAIESFSRQCALELRHLGIRSNSICPGFVNTPMVEENECFQRISSSPYRDLLIANPVDVAYMALFLLSDASSFVTGTSQLIDGGAHLVYG